MSFAFSSMVFAVNVTTDITSRLDQMKGACPLQWEDVQTAISPPGSDPFWADTADTDAFKEYLNVTLSLGLTDQQLTDNAADKEYVAGKCTEERLQFLEGIHVWQIGDIRRTLITDAIEVATGWIKLEGQTIGKPSSDARYYGDDLLALYEVAKLWSPNTGGEDWDSNNVVQLPSASQTAWKEEIKFSDKTDATFSVVPGPPPVATIASCKALKQDRPDATDGVYSLKLNGIDAFDVYCDMTIDGGGWTVIQNRASESDFFLEWADYKNGFGELSGNFWLGNDKIHLITQTPHELYIALEAPGGETGNAKYASFSVSDENSRYQLTVSSFSGDIGDSFSYHSGRAFSTKDRDNDSHSKNCAVGGAAGAWWYGACYNSNLNGAYGASVIWAAWKGYSTSMLKTRMMIRPQ